MVSMYDFLADIIEHPADDTPRLIYADWLDEHGQAERAEFIRVQCELAKLEELEKVPSGLSVPRWKDRQWQLEALRCRERELLDVTANWSGWTHAAFDGLAYDVGVSTNGTMQIVHLYDQRKNQIGEFSCLFRRGFVALVSCTLADWCGAECERCRNSWGHATGRGSWPGENCRSCHGVGRVGAHGPALVRAAPLERVKLAEWRGDSCHMCYRGSVPTDRDDNTCEVCHRLYNSAACLTWARSQPAPVSVEQA